MCARVPITTRRRGLCAGLDNLGKPRRPVGLTGHDETEASLGDHFVDGMVASIASGWTFAIEIVMTSNDSASPNLWKPSRDVVSDRFVMVLGIEINEIERPICESRRGFDRCLTKYS